MIYADNAATTPVSPAARAAMIDAMDKLYAQTIDAIGKMENTIKK